MRKYFERSQDFKADPTSILELINDFESYKRFLPGCLESKKLSAESDEVIRGLLVFGLLNQTYEFESANHIEGYTVKINQVSGPFSSFSASWSLTLLESGATNVLFQASFALPLYLQIFARQGVIDSMGERFVNAFATQISA
ncbi:SRPBCC family protein [Gammaproteobacteria bacterium]|nr:SRPBCC family protein [Gammaproteobacteria bacterium]MDA7851674.1 SRPBCC family protein [Gammaproteobacteria bacterium]MDA8925148.1 SRPBCC family protein [Gammaproteobacteria bacterium]MDA9341182.1 SRPBCC family protein [Gammaproteobacteria bacterium]MDB9700484.1 SRPBCC family protein [Gammaproteobacteria bacterium]|tara:strand:+ start:1436 stop:1861 length:426 start_codon:yes stop_codon:yes gene_type:complete